MSHPSDETFLDEMAETLRAVEFNNGVYPALVVSVPDFLRLVALARRAPALTCRTCQHYDRDAEGHDWCLKSVRLPINTFIHHPEFGCTLYAPAPPEAR